MITIHIYIYIFKDKRAMLAMAVAGGFLLVWRPPRRSTSPDDQNNVA